MVRFCTAFFVILSGVVSADAFTPSTHHQSKNSFHITGQNAKSRVPNSVLVRMGKEDDDNDNNNGFWSSPAASLQGLLKPMKDGKRLLVKSLAGEYDEEATLAKLKGLIADNRILMLSFTTWPFCVKAKDLLDSKPGVKGRYTVVELDKMDDGKAIRAEMFNVIDRSSVPAIFFDGDFIGGCNDGGSKGGLMTMDASGELDPLLQTIIG